MTWTTIEHDALDAASAAARLKRLRTIAWAVDGLFRLPGTKFRFGLNSVIGLTPAAGDVMLAGISLYIVNEARKIGLPKEKIARMLANIGVEAAAGAVPLLGNLFDMGFKANLRNIAIIEEHLGAAPTARRWS
ncbi:DUF4112 domain-containing protein [Lichenibacterium ramalinae]|uniref:DUF4112 domain-containing protein n=1 Tax=Lichenibacterium ramalinae TaxID=2316527 RepID=A0A4Q2RD42_9HYPH|nr:DUF4112 domain-containing protein [Lichenibacterium ramalinae]RYB05635.1 DUF4112 domain-containing protein [Lichenibacterium ramalinae]